MDNQRLILFVALAAVLMMIWQAWQEEHAPRQPTPVATPDSVGSPAARGAGTVPQAPDVPASGKTAAQPAAAPLVSEQSLRRGKQITVVTDLVVATIDSYGGDLRSLKLVKHPIAADKPDQPFPLLSDDEQTLFVAQSGLVGRNGQYPNHETRYTVRQTRYELAPGKDKLDVELKWRANDGTRYTKIYTFHRDSYVIDVSYRVQNNSRTTKRVHQYGQFRRRHQEKGRGLLALPTYVGGAIYTPQEQYEKIDFSDMGEEPLKLDVKGGWVAMMQHYFVSSWMPAADANSRFYSRKDGASDYIIGLTSADPVVIGPGQQAELTTQLYAGTKEQKRLKDLATGMDLTVDFGWLTFISAPLYWLLAEIHDWVGNWGWAIIFLTMIIKAVFFPLSAASYKSMAHMRQVQPRLVSIKERYGDDKQGYNKAMMEIYKKEKINPLGGCLPILIQIPVFIALYWVLLESVEMRHAPFALWIQDLSSPDPFFVLPLIMGASMFIQHHLNPAPVDPIQKRIMQFMPIMFTVFFLFFPAGLVLYWVVNNVLSIAQQWQITRMIEAKGK